MIDNCFVLIPPNKKFPSHKNWGLNPVSSEVARRHTDNGGNLGILLGPDSGIIDVDRDSPEAAAAFDDMFGSWSLGPHWSSLRGDHDLCQFDPRFRKLPSVVKWRGIEFRLGSGGQTQTVIPPSTVSGFRRSWTRDLSHPLPKLPESVIEAIVEAAEKQTSIDYEPDPLFSSAYLADYKLAKITAYLSRNSIEYRVERLRHGGFKVRMVGCPFKQGADGDPTILIGADGSHGFKCFHAKCASLGWDDFEELFGSLDPVIKITDDLAGNSRDAIRALPNARNVFQLGGVLVTISGDAPKPPMALVDNGSPKLVQLVPATLAPLLTTCARFKKFDGRSKEWKRCLPPANIVAAVDAATDLPGIPPIRGIINSPALRADGSILGTPGYDELTGLYLDADETFPSLTTPSEAVAAFDDVLADFPFATPAHRSAAIALIVTMLARPAFAGPAPFFLADANASRAGKGLLTDVATMIVEGRKAARFSPPTSDDEFRKVISTSALSGVPYVLFDNIKAKFGGQALENALTGGRWNDRLLGGNKSIDLELTWTWIGTSNNAVLTADMIGRTCHVRLDVQVERPELRTGFRHADLLGYVRENRRKLAMAALSIPAAYIKAGRPDQYLPAWGGFEGWSALVRNALVWSGLPDPGETREALRDAADDDTENLRLLVEGWRELGFPATVAAALDRLTATVAEETDPYPKLRELVADLPGDRKNSLGQILKASNGRVIGGHKFVKQGPKKWAVVAA